MFIQEYIAADQLSFESICKKHSVDHIYAFGSATNESFDETNSDIDLIVEVDESDPIRKGELLMDLWDQLEEYFDKKVDLLTFQALTNPILKKEIDKSKVKIYEDR
ncbi:MAG: nucleotidyltransferase domain-containing protein [Cyclobacteriaceae bacterium]|nr:nucleotidyltransferase domain-containing protein [Cyclobacteriaceae bacterium HetDA_MAG_MS6]